MTRAARVLALLLCLGATAWARGPAGPGGASESGDEEALAVLVEHYTSQPPVLADRAGDLPPLMAPASGGLLGWLVPQFYLWYPEVEGDVSDISGSTLDLEATLGIHDADLSFIPRFQVSLGGVGLYFDAFFVRFAGAAVVTESFEFGGITVEVDERISSHIRADSYRLMLLVPVVRTDVFALHLQAGAALLRLESTVVGELSGTGTMDVDVPIPLVGVLFQTHVGPFLLELDVAGMDIGYSDMGGTALDVSASVGITAFRILGLRAGYRYQLVEGFAEDFRMNTQLQGFFFGVSLQF